MSAIEATFTELFFGSGSWLGILLLLAIITALALKAKYMAVLMLPVCIFLGIDYLTNELFWNAIIMFLTTMFIIIGSYKRT